ncbi:unnamed protein product [Spirodela intermedia]|uniref:Dirigent protein n=1 Tax=Spirodela intermedia TaxID=51605 RepID=A0A7I8J4U8_SPIIN|nr:unnamed protein product [Spirodela intermedia]CAA6664410.1 unnamed protein product [Spirodela intermedia]
MAWVAVRPDASLAAVLVIILFLTPAEGYAVRAGRALKLGKEKVTYLHFFLHDTVSDKNPTAVQVASPNSTRFPFGFGSVFVVDDVLTEAVERSSPVVGNAQRIEVLTGLDKFSVVMTMDVAFTTGKYKGSSFSVMSRNPITEMRRELAVVGERGKFRLARGVAQITTRLLKYPDAIIEYNVTLFHY